MSGIQIRPKDTSTSRNRVKNIPHNRVKPERRLYYTSEQRQVIEQTLKPPLPIKKFIFYLTVLVCALVALIWVKINVDNTAQKVKNLQKEILDQQSKNQYTQRELDRESTYEIIYPYVSTRLGMELPKMPKILVSVPEHVISPEKDRIP